MATRKRFSVEVLPNAEPGPVIIDLLAGAAEFAAVAKLAPRDSERLAIVIEELTSNCMRHGARACGLQVALTLSMEPDSLKVLVIDDGMPFDPTARAPFRGPDPQTGGGVGLELVKTWCDQVVYRREGQTNRLELRLPLGERR